MRAIMIAIFAAFTASREIPVQAKTRNPDERMTILKFQPIIDPLPHAVEVAQTPRASFAAHAAQLATGAAIC